MSGALRRDVDEFASEEEAQQEANRLNGLVERQDYFVVKASVHGDVWRVQAPNGRFMPNPVPPQKINPHGNRRPDTSFSSREAAEAEAARRNAGLETPQFVVMQHRVYGHWFVVDPQHAVSSNKTHPADHTEILKPATGGIEMVDDGTGHTKYTGQRRHG